LHVLPRSCGSGPAPGHFAGELLGVSATRALELGIDIGSLDACIIVGYTRVDSALVQPVFPSRIEPSE